MVKMVWSGVMSVALGLTFVSSASAASLTVEAGILTGARGVNVGGFLYDVEFRDGTCIALFGGCDNAAEDFAFQTQANAIAAAQALLDQVFLDGPLGAFDTNPTLTRGCSFPSCQAYVPFGFVDPNVVRVGLAINYGNSLFQDATGASSLGRDEDKGQDERVTYAVFTPAAPVPEPTTLLLTGTALAGLVLRRRRVA